MTGYAKVQSVFGDKKLNIEIKTLNSKQLDLIVKIPAAYRSRELDIRAMLGRLERGKVECILSEESTDTDTITFNRDLVSARFNAHQPRQPFSALQHHRLHERYMEQRGQR